jgi:hypothetical protein
VDFLYGVPYMFLVILIMLMFSETARGQPLPVFLALGLVQWLTMARIVRGQVLIIARHILPNVVGVVAVYATLTVPAVIILESFLSFLGLGVALSWGELVAEAVGVVNPIESYWWLLVWPSVFLAATLFSLNFDERAAPRRSRSAHRVPYGRGRRAGRGRRELPSRPRRDRGPRRRVRLRQERDEPVGAGPASEAPGPDRRGSGAIRGARAQRPVRRGASADSGQPGRDGVSGPDDGSFGGFGATGSRWCFRIR